MTTHTPTTASTHPRLRPEGGRERNSDSGRYIYEIDGDDRIVAVSPSWDRFALANDAAHVTEAHVVGSSLWDWIVDFVTRQLYTAILASARESGQLRRVPFRCDAPALRRFMELEIVPARGRHLTLTGRTLVEEPRDAVVLLRRSVARSASQFVSLCGWCKAARLPDGHWGEVEELVRTWRLFDEETLPEISHAICPDCEAAVRAGL
jgi:hypothetical protein